MKRKFMREVYAITFQTTATELMAAILESTEIKRLWPIFNTSQKRTDELFGIFVYEDQNGYMRLAIEKKRKHANPIYTFHYKVDGLGIMKKLVRSFSLCPKLCFVQTDNTECQNFLDYSCYGACEKREPTQEYNARVLKAIASLTHRPSYVVLDKGMNEKDISCIMVVKGSFFGMGYLPKDLTCITESAVSPYVQPYKENNFIRSLLNAHITHHPHQVTHLQD